MKRLLVVAGLSLILGASFLAPARAGQDYPPTGVDITLRDSDGNTTTTFFAGENGTVTASGLFDNTTYDSKFNQSPGVVIGTGNSNGNGNLSDSFRIPTSANIGAATFSLDPRGRADGDISVAIRIVSQADAKVDGVVLPKTGTRIDQYIGIGVGLVVIGAIIVALVRRRRAGEAGRPDRELQSA